MSFNDAMRRPVNYHLLPADQQWQIDKLLGILDWDGEMTDEQLKQYYERFNLQ